MSDKNLQKLIEPVVEQLGYEPVRILLTGQVRQKLQVMIDVKDARRAVTVEDCAKVSRALSKLLDEEDPIKGEYSLEVSSPGIDRPLTKPHHFAHFKGYEAKIETLSPVDARKRFRGILGGLDANGDIIMDMDDKRYVIAFENIAKAKLVMTDALLQSYEANNEN